MTLRALRAVRIPEVALIPRGDHVEVLVVNDNDIVENRTVRPGARAGGRVEILDGLQDSELVIVEGWQSARPGSKVAVRFVKSPAAHPWSDATEGHSAR
jgi:multidrug efflux pump subunit AcrA (membrane-fusion protein)